MIDDLISLMDLLSGFKKFKSQFYDGLISFLEDEMRHSKANDIIEALWSMRQILKIDGDRLEQLTNSNKVYIA